MKRLLSLFAAMALVVLTFATTGFFTLAAGPVPAGLQFVPLVQVAPDDNTNATVPSPACTSPAPVHTSADFHCYTPSDIYAAYGVDKLHADGLTGKGETIVIVDSYGSPTALSDLQFFSTTFGLPAPNLTILNPAGTPTPSGAMHGVQLLWAEETSLDLQWAHAIAPDARSLTS